MKRLILICIGYTVLAGTLSAQVLKNRRIESARIAFITQRLDLSPDEAQQFWPIFNNYQKELAALKLAGRRQLNNPGVSNSPDDELEFDTRILDLKKRYRKDFARVITPKKAGLLFQAERDFRLELIKRLNNKRN